MIADYLRQCLFLYPDWKMEVDIDGVKKELTSVMMDSDKKIITLYGRDKTKTRDVE